MSAWWRVTGYQPRPGMLAAVALVFMTVLSTLVLTLDERGSDALPICALAYSSHGVITIDGDTQFAEAAALEGWPGDGSAGNPYVISGFEINGTGYRWSICINNTRAHFEIVNCWLHDGTDAGLELHNVSNALASDLKCERTGSYGIVTVSSNGNSFVNNNCSQATYGIYLFTSSNNTIRGSTCSQLILDTGLYLGSSNNNTIAANDFSSDPASRAILLMDSDRNNVSGNTCWWTGYGIVLQSSSNNNTIAQNSLGGNTIAVQLQSSPANTIANNLVSGDLYAVVIQQSYDVTVIGNNHGKISVVSSYNCLVSSNNCTDGGIALGASDWNVLDNNMCNFVRDGADGIHLEESDNNTIMHNNCSSNYKYGGIAVPYPDGCGIFLLSSDNNTIRNNSCLFNMGAGIEGFDCYGNVVMGNDCSFNQGMYGSTGDGITIGARTIANNICIGNTEYGLTAVGSGVSVTNNFCIDNRMGGIMLGGGSTGSGLTGNVLVRNGIVFSRTEVGIVGSWSIDTSNMVNGLPVQYLKDMASGTVPLGAGQVILVNCSNVNVEGQTLNNASIGLQMFSCSSLFVLNNTCSYNHLGMLVSGVSNSTFTGNAIYDNIGYGISMQGSVYNTLWNNSFARNNGAGTVYSLSNIQVYDYYTNRNRWNISGYGNYWSDWISPDAIPPYGIVDQPYVISEFNIVQDYFPLVSPLAQIPPPIPEFEPAFLVLGLVALVLGLSLFHRRGTARR